MIPEPVGKVVLSTSPQPAAASHAACSETVYEAPAP
jgi:hypothetical protein